MDKIKKALHTLELANLAGEDIQKARVTKYYRREGGPGNYKYYYTKEEYDEAKGGVKKEEGSVSVTREDISKWMKSLDEEYSDNWALMKSSEFGKLDFVKDLVKNGKDIKIDFALAAASGKGHLDIVKFLFKNGADIHIQNDYPLRDASLRGHLDVVKFLAQNGADIHTNNDEPLRHASQNGHLDVVKFLVQNGANVNAGNNFAIQYASDNGHLDVVKFLVQSGADIHENALRWAKSNGHTDLYKYLQSKSKSKEVKKSEIQDELDSLILDLEKGRPHKYYRREGSPGNYKYYYTKAEYDKAKGVKKEETTSKKKVDTEKITWVEEWLDNDTGAVVAEKHSGDYIGNEGLNKMKNEYDKLYSDLASKKAKASKETRDWENRDHRYKNKVDVLRSEVKEREEEIRQINSEMEANAPEGGGGDEYAEEWTKRLGNLHEELKEVQEELEEAKKDFGEHEDKYPSMDEDLLDEIESDEKKLFEMERVISEQDKLRKVARVKDMLTDLVNDPPEGFYEDVADTFGEPDDDGESESALIERIMSGAPLSMVEDWVHEQNSKSTKKEIRKAEYLGALQELGLDIEKGRTREGVYANTSENRKLGRVGQKYKKKDSVEDKKEGKKESSSPKERDLTGMVVNDVIDDIEKDISKFWRINAVDTSPLGGTFKRIHFSSLEWSNPIREYIKGKYGVDPKLEHNVRAGSVTLKIPKKSIVNMRKYLTDKEFRQSVSEQARHGTLVGGKGRPVRS